MPLALPHLSGYVGSHRWQDGTDAVQRNRQRRQQRVVRHLACQHRRLHNKHQTSATRRIAAGDSRDRFHYIALVPDGLCHSLADNRACGSS